MALHELKNQPFINQKLFFCTSLSLSLPKAPLFHHKRCKSALSHNLLSTKEYSCSFNLRSKSLRCNAGTSHRFKAFSPPFCAKSRFRLVSPESFAKIFFGRALNRGRRTESRVLFGYFLHAAKSDNPFLCRKLRGSANLDSARRNGGFALTKLKPFAALGGILPAAIPPFLLLTQHFLPLRGLFFGGHAAFLCCLRQPTAALRRLFPTFCKVQKVEQKNFENFLSEILPCRDSTLRVHCAAKGGFAKKCNFLLTNPKSCVILIL